MIIILIVVLGLAGWRRLFRLHEIHAIRLNHPRLLKSREKPLRRVPPNLGIMFSLDPFIVNLAGSQGKRFLKVTVSLELSAPEIHAEVKENIQKIMDSILVLLSSKNFEDVYSVQGKFKLKDEITARVNRFLVLGHIKEAYFTEFIIQSFAVIWRVNCFITRACAINTSQSSNESCACLIMDWKTDE